MIDGRLLFSQDAKWAALKAFFHLPDALRPATVSVGENEVGEPIHAGDDLSRLLGWRSGFFLNGEHVSYDVSTSNPAMIECNCYLDIEPRLAEEFLFHMSTASPLFAYLSTAKEEQARNKLRDKVGLGTIESWVGRSIDKYIPGLYWLTLLPEALAAKHRVSISALAEVAFRHSVLDGAQHLFRFYDRPEDWSSTDTISGLCSSTPGIFDIEQVKVCVAGKDTLTAYIEATRAWP